MADQTLLEQAAPDVQARVSASFDRQGLIRQLGASLTHVGPGRVHITLPCADWRCSPSEAKRGRSWQPASRL